MKKYTVMELAETAGISVRTLHYYDQIGLLKPAYRARNGYRYYADVSTVKLQQIMFFRELGFSLEEIGKIITDPNFDVLEALQSHRILLDKKAARIEELRSTLDKTIKNITGEAKMEIKEYYKGFGDEQIESYRAEVRRRWGQKALDESESRVLKMGKKKFDAVQAEGGRIFRTISDNMSRGYDSSIVQAEVANWRQWLEHFHHYSEEALIGLGRMYSDNADFAGFFEKIHKDLPEFLTKAIEYYCAKQK